MMCRYQTDAATTITDAASINDNTDLFCEVITTVVIVSYFQYHKRNTKQKNKMVQAKLMFTMATLALANAFSPSSQGPQTVRGMKNRKRCVLFVCMQRLTIQSSSRRQ